MPTRSQFETHPWTGWNNYRGNFDKSVWRNATFRRMISIWEPLSPHRSIGIGHIGKNELSWRMIWFSICVFSVISWHFFCWNQLNSGSERFTYAWWSYKLSHDRIRKEKMKWLQNWWKSWSPLKLLLRINGNWLDFENKHNIVQIRQFFVNQMLCLIIRSSEYIFLIIGATWTISMKIWWEATG